MASPHTQERTLLHTAQTRATSALRTGGEPASRATEPASPCLTHPSTGIGVSTAAAGLHAAGGRTLTASGEAYPGRPAVPTETVPASPNSGRGALSRRTAGSHPGGRGGTYTPSSPSWAPAVLPWAGHAGYAPPVVSFADTHQLVARVPG